MLRSVNAVERRTTTREERRYRRRYLRRGQTRKHDSIRPPRLREPSRRVSRRCFCTRRRWFATRRARACFAGSGASFVRTSPASARTTSPTWCGRSARSAWTPGAKAGASWTGAFRRRSRRWARSTRRTSQTRGGDSPSFGARRRRAPRRRSRARSSPSPRRSSRRSLRTRCGRGRTSPRRAGYASSERCASRSTPPSPGRSGRTRCRLRTKKTLSRLFRSSPRSCRKFSGTTRL